MAARGDAPDSMEGRPHTLQHDNAVGGSRLPSTRSRLPPLPDRFGSPLDGARDTFPAAFLPATAASERVGCKAPRGGPRGGGESSPAVVAHQITRRRLFIVAF